MKPAHQNPVTETRDRDENFHPGISKTNIFLVLLILDLFYEVLNKYYPRERKFRSDLYSYFLNSDLSFQEV